MNGLDQLPEDPSKIDRLPGCSMRKDPCYQKYAEALQCLDKHDYQHDQCAGAFQAFTDCRRDYATVSTKNLTSGIQQDPLFGPLLQLWNSWSDSRKQGTADNTAAEQQQQQQQQQQQHSSSAEDEKPWRRKKQQQQQQQEAQ